MTKYPPVREALLSAWLIAFMLLISLPILKAGYYSDDSVNSLIAGTIKNQHTGFWRFVSGYMNYWLQYGRFFPLSVLSSTAVFNGTANAFQYQLVRLVFIWMSVFSFAVLVRILTKDHRGFWWMIVLLPACWSIHDTPDAMTSFAIFLPLVVIFAAWALIFLERYLDFRESVWLDLSLLMFLFDLLCYEVALATLPMVVLLVSRQSETMVRKIRILVPYGLMTLAYLMLYLVVQHLDTDTYNGVKFSLNSHFFHAFLMQVEAALPLSFLWLATHTQLNSLMIATTSPATALLVMLSGFMVLYCLLGNMPRVEKRNLITLALLGGILVLFPAALIGVSEKYQVLVSAGRGYIPVYVQNFGMALLLFVVVCEMPCRISSKVGRSAFSVAVSLLFSGILTVSWLVNGAVVDQNNEDYYNERALLEEALRQGFVTRLPEGAWLVEKLVLWNTRDFYAMKSPIRLAGVIDLNDTRLQSADLSSAEWYYIEVCHLHHSQEGFVMIGRMEARHVTRKALAITDSVTLNAPSVFVMTRSEKTFGEVKAVLLRRLGQDVDQASFQFHADNPALMLTLPHLHLVLPIQYLPAKKLPY